MYKLPPDSTCRRHLAYTDNLAQVNMQLTLVKYIKDFLNRA
jgi:hypothetical protein